MSTFCGTLFIYLNITKGKYIRMASDHESDKIKIVEIVIYLFILCIVILLIRHFKYLYEKL